MARNYINQKEKCKCGAKFTFETDYKHDILITCKNKECKNYNKQQTFRLEPPKRLVHRKAG